MKKAAGIVIGLFSCAILILLLLMGGMIWGNRGEEVQGTMGFSAKLVNTQELDLRGMEEISLIYSLENMEICHTDSENLILEEYMSFEPKEEELAQIRTKNGKVTIEGGRKRNRFHLFSFGTGNCYIKLYLPKSYAQTLAVETSSGNIRSEENWELKCFLAVTSSGNIQLEETKAETIELAATSGNISVENAKGKRQIATSSGNIRVDGGAGDTQASSSSGNIHITEGEGTYLASATSGDLKIGLIKGEGDFSASSGNVTVEIEELTGGISAEASSGNVRLTLPKESSFAFQAKTGSGDIDTYFDDQLSFNKKRNEAEGTIEEAGGHSIRLRTSSGNIRVNSR